ncbi:MAG TPA: pullulanase-type alpha-1,6-glucosidase [Thermoanaerobaculia bacterium]|jgi:pullulanase-type alpha-1,6-glucosidase|nr:pullulanase-type alpha-1,6-glucosidase [Thermoanaerobaculia bacterium]
MPMHLFRPRAGSLRWSLASLLPLLLLALLSAAPVFANTPAPQTVTLAGDLQSELGCANDWMPDCAATHLSYDAVGDVWRGTFNVPAGNWQYKVALNNAWTENYGANAQSNGGNISLNLASPASVKFYYSHGTHWVTSNQNAVIATAPGSYQHFLGCAGDWQPDCLRAWLQDPDGDGIYTFATRSIPAGNYEIKVAIDESWTVNYGVGGVSNGANIPFTVASDCAETVFTYDSNNHVLTVSAGTGGGVTQPGHVTIPGSFQSELGCSGDWQADCAVTHLAYDSTDGIWQGTFNLPAGGWEYKAAINDAWDENYGANATPGGANIGLNLASPTAVKFYYDHATHWVTSNRNAVIATVPGSFQHFLGCSGDWQPDCLRSWLEDPDGDGIYTFSTRAIPPGNYEAKVAIHESWDENYGAGGVPNGPNIAFSVPQACVEMFFSYNATTHVLTVSANGAPKGNIGRAQGYWVTADTIAWNPGAVSASWNVSLHYDPNGGLTLDAGGVSGGSTIPLTYDPAGLSAAVQAKFPQIAGFQAFHVPASHLAEVPEALKSQIAVDAKDAGNALVDATGLQIQGVLDDLYTYNGALGATFGAGNAPTLRVWAPTARSVNLRLFADSNPATTSTAQPMTLDPATGVWSVTGNASWYGKYYLYEVNVFVRTTGHVETNLVTDPYSVSLSMNSQRSQIVSLADAAWKPAGWDSLSKPRLDAPEDIVLYELHVRDFSANDPSVPANLKGTFKAFTLNSNGMRHLRSLALAGLTHVHLLPSFDISSVNEDKSTWQSPAGDLSAFPPDSTEQQARVMAVANADGFNWGYDPWHYTVPEGSYSTNPDGPTRILEFRQMVQSLNQSGLRVVMDVVYNHTTAAGQNDHSVLDRIVPGYYYRLNGDGNITTSSCCQDTAAEFNMMEKLLVDSVLTWAKSYKVDGFRFDLMSFHMKRNMLKLRAALDALNVATDGVDGKKIYLYGEGWNFGEVGNNARGVNATQANMAGTGIGTFSDRLRDGVRGGGPFSGLQEQGFLTGLYTDPNATNQGSSSDQLNKLLLESDWVKTGLAGALASYQLVDRNGNLVTASQIDYNGQPAGYTADPQEVISYIEAHDNETLFDTIQEKAAPADTLADRVRMQNLGMSILGFGQGIPFYHAGVELLRSKSMDRNSYNSGDWFNKLDFTYDANSWGVGLPQAGDNQSNWPLLQPLLANPALKPGRNDILTAYAHFLETLAIRRSTPLFRLRTGDEVKNRVRFYNAGPSQIPGLIVMSVADPDGGVDRGHNLLAVVINAGKATQAYANAAFVGKALKLHPFQMISLDAAERSATFTSGSGSFSVPGRTAAVFWANRPATEQIGLLIQDVDNLMTAGKLTSGRGTALRAKLQAAQQQAQAGHATPASSQLSAFINQVQVFAGQGFLSQDDADALATNAYQAIGQLFL